MPLTEGASLVVIYRVLSPNFPLKSVVIYDGSAIPTRLDDVRTSRDSMTRWRHGHRRNHDPLLCRRRKLEQQLQFRLASRTREPYSAPLNAGSAYAAVILQTPVTNSDNDGILDAWKAGPPAGDFYAGQPGYYDVKTGSWVPLPGAQARRKGSVRSTRLHVRRRAGKRRVRSQPGESVPLARCAGQRSAGDGPAGIRREWRDLHLEIGNAVPENTCTDNTSTTPPQLCQFPGEPGVIGWKNSLEFSKLWPRNLRFLRGGRRLHSSFPLRAEGQLSLRSVRPLSGDTGMELALRNIDVDQCRQQRNHYRHH